MPRWPVDDVAATLVDGARFPVHGTQPEINTAWFEFWSITGGASGRAQLPPDTHHSGRCRDIVSTPAAVVWTGTAPGQLWYGSALSSVTLTTAPLGTVYSRVSPTLASISAAPSGELGE